MNNNFVDLTSNESRDANIETLECWHPAFYEVYPELQPIIASFRKAMDGYSRLLIEECSEPPIELLEHIEQEATLWMFRKLNKEAREAFKSAASNQPEGALA